MPPLAIPLGADRVLGSEANLITDYYGRIRSALGRLVPDAGAGDAAAFTPAHGLPELTDAMREFFAPATVSWQELGAYRGRRLMLLDLAGNPGTHTTKTFPSMLIVARALEHIRRTGEPIVIFSPTSANKGTALRDAVLRALSLELAEPEQLRIVTLAPRGCAEKFRASALSDDQYLQHLNPLFVYEGSAAEDVKRIGTEFAKGYRARVKQKLAANLWYSLDLCNYLVADTARAFFEHDVCPTTPGRARVHAHAVSSAFGLLGYHEGRRLLEEAGESTVAERPASLLVQHLGTPDMVLSLRHDSFDRSNVPAYTEDPETGLFHQDSDIRFPMVTDDPEEVLDPTFYTHRPATSPRMNAIIRDHGGDGIVVSLRECLERYPQIRRLLADVPRPLPSDPRRLTEWSLPMAFTGVLGAVDRGLIGEQQDVVVHGSGWYSKHEYRPLAQSALTGFTTAEQIASCLGI